MAAAVARSTLSLGVLLCLASACCAGVEEFPLQVQPGGEIPTGVAIEGYPAAVKAIVQVMVRDFRVPAPRGKLLVYGTREEFERGLVEHLKIKPALAKSTAKFAKGAVGSYNLLVSEPALAESNWPQRIEFLAHELTHCVQLTLANKPGIARPQWLMEGSAEWMAFYVTAALGLDDLKSVRMRLAEKVRAARQQGGLPRLVGVDTFEQWVATRGKYGFDATYSQSFLAADFLVARHTFARIADFFRRFERSDDAGANFNASFGESIGDFGSALDAHLEKLLN